MTGFIVIGINHKTAPVEIRERFSFTRSRLMETQNRFKISGMVRGSIILSTCNRMEIYARSFSNSNEACMAYLVEFLTERFSLSEKDLKKYFYILENEQAVGHIFEVACGLDSQVLGEIEILSQVKSAHLASRESGFTTDCLDAIFEKAVLVGLSARRSTGISQGKVSTGSVAMAMLKDRLRSLKDKTVLIIGSGKIASLMSKYLKEERIKSFFVSSRTYAKACELAMECGGEAIRFYDLLEKLKDVDIVISSTASPHIILKKKSIEEVMSGRKKPLLLLDLAVPRDIEPEAGNIAGVSLYDLDDLTYVVERNYDNRKREVMLVRDIIEKELRVSSSSISEEVVLSVQDRRIYADEADYY